MQPSIPLKIVTIVLKKKRKKVKVAEKQTKASLHLKECDEKNFILLE